MNCYLLMLLALAVLVSLLGAQTLEKHLEQAYHDAIKATREIEDADMRLDVLITIAEVLTKAGQFDRSIKVAKTIDEPIMRLKAFATIMAAKHEAEKRKNEKGQTAN